MNPPCSVDHSAEIEIGSVPIGLPHQSQTPAERGTVPEVFSPYGAWGAVIRLERDCVLERKKALLIRQYRYNGGSGHNVAKVVCKTPWHRKSF